MEVNEPWMVTEFNLVQPLKALTPIEATLLPRVSVFRDVFPEKVANDDKWLMFLPMYNVSIGHPLKAFSKDLKSSTTVPSCMASIFNAVQFWKALELISVMLFGIVIAVNPLHPLKTVELTTVFILVRI